MQSLKDKLALGISMSVVWFGIWGWMHLVNMLHSWLFA